MRSLRAQLFLFWLVLLVLCSGLAFVMWQLFQNSAGTQIEASQTTTRNACTSIASRYAKSMADPHADMPQLDLLQVLLQLVLVETPRVEGGIWRSDGGFLAYSYPTYEGSGVKRDVPQAEQAHIVEIAQVAARSQSLQIDVVRASREALILVACPLQSPRNDLVAWSMTRTSVNTLDAQQNLRAGLGVLLVVAVCSAAWLSLILFRGSRYVQRLEQQLDATQDDELASPIQPTGVFELDRLVTAVNRYRNRFEHASRQLRVAEAQHARDERLTALGRMTGGVAHEIRNPIAAMRLKAENALAGPVDRQPEALNVILAQIGRLDELVQRLLAVVQPLQLAMRTVELRSWLQERVESAKPKAQARSVDITIEGSSRLEIDCDPVHLMRAVDNLLDNAIRHAHRRVDVLIDSTPKRVLIRIDDDGEGVAETMQDHLFEPFATGRPDGTGLGLALALEVALAHGGALRHVAKPDGTRFELELPWHMS